LSAPSAASSSSAVSSVGRAAIIGGGAIGGAALASSSASADVNPRATLTAEQNSSSTQNRISSLSNTQTISSAATPIRRNEPALGQEANNFSSRILNINAREIVFKADKFDFDQPTNNTLGSQQSSFQQPRNFSHQTPAVGAFSNERLLRPTDGRVTSGFGQRAMGNHEGLDFGVPVGSPIISSQSGTVVDVRSSPSYGNLVRVRGNNGVETLYAHLSSANVQPGQQVQQGQQIALSGNTGRSTGPHLHYEVIRDGRRVDPAPLIGAAGEAPRPTQEQNIADAPLSAPPNSATQVNNASQSSATQVSSQPNTGAQIMQSSTQNEIASQQITVSSTESRPSINQPEQTDPASAIIDPNDPGSVEPNDSSDRYSRLFGIAA
jgi:murein DD-endopeptidase MepM/ murein hydrolase activator NlpD